MSHSRVGLRARIAAVAVAAWLALPAPSWGVEGTLDQSFGSGGKVETAIGSDAFAQSVAVDSQGRLVVAGSALKGSNYAFTVARYLSSGALDPSFGTGGTGIVTTPIGSGDDYASKVDIDSQGRIVVAGENCPTSDCSTADFALARYLPNGTLDTSFHTTGTETTSFGSGEDAGIGLGIDSQGRIVVGGYAFNGSNEDFALARYEANGDLDTSFSGTGKVIQPIGSGDDEGIAVAVDSQNRILLGGDTRVGTHLEFALARFTTAGALDTTFNGTGFATLRLGAGTSDEIKAMAIDSQGRILAAGGSIVQGTDAETFAVARYDPDGTPDPTFGSGGVTTATAFPADSEAHAVAVDRQGRIVAAGNARVNANPSSRVEFALVRYDAHGALDASFGTGGSVMTEFNGVHSDSANGIAIDSKERIVAVGQARNVANTALDFGIARYLGDAAAPAVTIKSGPRPGAFIKDPTPTFGFTVDDPTATATCGFDSASGVGCSSPFTPSPRLADGRHTLTVAAADPAGNVGRAQRSFTVDTRPPKLKIQDKSMIATGQKRGRARFRLKTDERAKLRCRVDHRKTRRCNHRYRTPKLGLGKHTLKVVATDRARNRAHKTKGFRVVTR